MAGIFHAYYTVALAPSVAALVGIGGWVLWRERHDPVARLLLGLVAGASGVWAFVLLDRTPDFLPWLRYVVLVGGLFAAAGLAGATYLPRRLGPAVAALAVLTTAAAPVAYSVSTVAQPQTGSIVTAGPVSTARMGGRPGGMVRMALPPGGMRLGFQPGMQANAQPAPPGAAGTLGRGGGGGNAGGLLDGSAPTSELTELLEAGADSYTWVAAAVGSNSASGYQLATQEPVMAIGGFNGSDPSPTLAEFEAYVAAGKIHYFIAGGGFGGPGGPGGSGSSTSSAISSWVQANFEATTVGGVTVYDLSGGAA